MDIKVYRYNSDDDHSNSVILVNGRYQCDGLEDEYRATKEMHETRIPAGCYKIEFRTTGGFHARYLDRYGATWHKGMLWIKEVPGFEFILIHSGNHDDHTSGCLLVGRANANDANFVGSSRDTYEKFYPKVRNALLRGEEVWIEFINLDKVE